MDFEYQALPWNVVFGCGAIKQLPSKLAEMGLERALILSTPERETHASLVTGLLPQQAVGNFNQAVMHVPVETVTQALSVALNLDADCTISIGGGSTTGLGKALALKGGLANIAIPTTYAGSEMTNVWGMTEHGRKNTGRDNVVVPSLTIYDPELTLGLPAAISGPSGINAMAQAVVNVTASKPNPIISALALDGIRALGQSLETVVNDPTNIEARSSALYGACLAGGSLGLGITGLHHKICHTLGGTYNTSHADTHAIMLAHSVKFNAVAVPDGTAKVAEALGCDDAAEGIFRLLHSVSQKTSLPDIGIEETQLDDIADLVVEKEISNPRPVTRAAVREILDAAYHGHLVEP